MIVNEFFLQGFDELTCEQEEVGVIWRRSESTQRELVACFAFSPTFSLPGMPHVIQPPSEDYG